MTSSDTYQRQFEFLKLFLVNSGKNYNIDLIVKAYEYAVDLHRGQYRKSGEDYITHPIAVAQICANFRFDTTCICTALLHDVVEDCPDKTNLGELTKIFGKYDKDIPVMVDGMTKLKSMEYVSEEQKNLVNLKKMFLSMSKDPRVIFVKLCDRLHNMRTISSMAEHKQRRIALETMHVFAPIAHRLGMNKIKDELEDMGLQCLDPIGYKQIVEEFDKIYGQHRDLIEKSQEKIKERLIKENIRFTFEGRVKTISSLYKKIFGNGKDIPKSAAEVYDYYALRVIVQAKPEVYEVLGIVHDLFSCIPERFKDFISTPKENGYQSLHTTVRNNENIPFEIQIRTSEMHENAEFGLAAHWKYKEDEEADEYITKQFRWLATLVDDDNVVDSEEYIGLLNEGFYSDEIYVFTPKNDVKFLPKGATIIDFAYAIHSAVGNKAIGAKVNGVIAPINQELENGQYVEIITSNASKGPNRNWLNFVKTGEARNKIRQWYKKEKRAENILIGISEVDKVFKQQNYALKEQEKTDILVSISAREGFTTVDDFYNAIGYGGLMMSKISYKIRDEILKLSEEKEEINSALQIPLEEERRYSDNTIIIVEGMDNCQVKLAKCCNPVPGDQIQGFMTQGHGLSVHKVDCRNFLLLKKNPDNAERLLITTWNKNKTDNSYSNEKNFKVTLKVVARKGAKLFAAISTMMDDLRVPIHSINDANIKHEDNILIHIHISVRDLSHLDYIINRLKTIQGVKEIYRSFN